MGRHLKINGCASQVAFDCDKPEVVVGLKTIAKREGVKIREIYNRAFDEYLERHAPGNYQTMLGSFEPGGLKSDVQVEQKIIDEITKKYYSKEVQFIYLAQVCREYGFEKDAPAHANMITKRLVKDGWKIWRK